MRAAAAAAAALLAGPASAQCPGGSLDACVAGCPTTPPTVYYACIKRCGDVCPGGPTPPPGPGPVPPPPAPKPTPAPPAPAPAPPAPPPAPVPKGAWKWKNVNSQGFGWVTAVIHHPNQKVCKGCTYAHTDVGGAFRLDRSTTPEQWVPITDAFGPGTDPWATNSMAVDPDKDIVYLSVDRAEPGGSGEVMMSADRGSTWAFTGLGKAGNIPISNNRWQGEALAVAPGSGTVVLGTLKNGTWFLKKGAGWARGTGLPADAAVWFVQFAGGKAYAGVAEHGIYTSADEGATWAAVAACSFAKQPHYATATAAALIFTYQDVGAGKGGIARLDLASGACTDTLGAGKAGDGDQLGGVSAHGDDVVGVTSGFSWFHSKDGGKTFTQQLGFRQVTGEVKWMKNRTSTYFSTMCSITIDPSDPKALWTTDGVGILRTQDYTAGGDGPGNQAQWGAVMQGLEMNVANTCVSPPLKGGADVIYMAWDFLGLRHQSKDAVPDGSLRRAMGLSTSGGIDRGINVAYCKADPNVVAITGSGRSGCLVGISRDNGRSFTRLCGDSLPKGVPDYANVGGGLVVITGDACNDVVWAPVEQGEPSWCMLHSHDGGKTWACATGLPTGAPFQQGNTAFPSRNMVADTDGTLYFTHNSEGCFKSVDKGETWTKVSTGYLPTAWKVKVTLDVNPSKTGDLWLSGETDDPTQSPIPLYHSPDGGATWSPVASTKVVDFFAFGAPAAAGGPPSLFIHGTVAAGGPHAVYMSTDLAASWQQISDPARDGFGLAAQICADMREHTVYIPMNGRSLMYGVPP